MKNLLIKNFFKNKKVIITGHTGFKGSWLTLWLQKLGAKILGISLGEPTYPCHFKMLNLEKKINSKKIDIRNLILLKKTIKNFKPDFIFHLAAQSLVKKSYLNPIDTWKTNTFGTLNILESLKNLNKECFVVLITSDKVYKNLEIKKGYDEKSRLGGYDPYSASKASAEIAIESYINSYFSEKSSKVKICIARAGNVIGGGDWSENRLIPDCIKSWSKKNQVLIRNPYSTRPWQHVLEAISGYLILAIKLKLNKKLHGEAFNFGPKNQNNFKVISVLKMMKKKWKNISWKIDSSSKNRQYESKLLKLNSNKAKKILNWKSILTLEETLDLVVEWYKNFYVSDKTVLSLNQIEYFERKIKTSYK